MPTAMVAYEALGAGRMSGASVSHQATEQGRRSGLRDRTNDKWGPTWKLSTPPSTCTGAVR